MSSNMMNTVGIQSGASLVIVGQQVAQRMGSEAACFGEGMANSKVNITSMSAPPTLPIDLKATCQQHNRVGSVEKHVQVSHAGLT